MPSNLTLQTLSKLDLGQLNRVLSKIQLDINALQGRSGKVTIEDSLSVKGDLSVGGGTIGAGLLATLGGYSGRPVAPFIHGQKSISDATLTPLFTVDQSLFNSSTHGVIIYGLNRFVDAGNRSLSETGITVYTGNLRASGALNASVLPTATPSIQALSASTMTTAFSVTIGTTSYNVEVTLTPSGGVTRSMLFDFWVWPLIGDVTLL